MAQRALARAQRVHQRENKPPTPPVAEALLQVRVQQILIPTPSVYKPGCLGEAHLPEKLENKNSSTSDIHLGRLNMKIHVNVLGRGVKHATKQSLISRLRPNLERPSAQYEGVPQ